MSQPWHSKKSTQDRLLAFHASHAAFPQAAVRRAQQTHEAVMRELSKALQEQGTALRFEYTGSSYEGLKVGSTDMEFDVMVVLSGGSHLKEEVVRSGWAKLKPMTNMEQFRKAIGQGQTLDPMKGTSNFFGVLRKAIDSTPTLKNLIKLRMHGPAVQMDVYENAQQSRLQYSVDMVPAYQLLGEGAGVESGKYYVAKPLKGEQSDGLSWRRSFSLQEKNKLITIDQGNKCAKQCIRIFKVLRDTEPGLHGVVSYWLKTTIFNLQKEKPNLNWEQTNMRERFFDMMQYLADSLERGKLKHHFLPKVNLLENISPVQRSNIYTRLRELIRSEDQFNKALDKAMAK